MEKKITQFKNGDIIVGDNGCCSYITIFKSHRDPSSFNHYASYTSRGYFQINGYASSLNLRFATEDERQILFKQLRLNGYQWNEENKTLIDWNIPRFKVGDRIRSIKNPNEEYTITAIYKFAYNCKNDIYTDFTIFIKRQTDWELVPNKNMRTQETQEQKEQRVKSIIESYKIINKDYVLIQIHDEVILCFPNKESALQSLKDDIMYNKRQGDDEMVNFYLWIYFRINEGQRIYDLNGENEMEVCGNEEVICK
jgi:hypothetical protein